MASPSAVSEDRKSDDLEIVSVGALYSGSCDKKYWSSSRNGAESYSIDADTPDTSLMCSCSDSGKLMGVVDSFSVNSNSALILWKTVSCAALRTSKRGMDVATHAELLAAENELLAAEGTSVMKENVTHETSQSDQNSKSIILQNPGVIIKTIVLLFGVYRNRCHIQLMLILYKMFKYDWSYVSNLKFSSVCS
uniref:Uncharacterized protein n=1 Tax=Brassica oleracea TaxID=3712 RepID=A0A3P6DUM6_BRAOL|nr:unnamed protein product [Brassica oleracea]